MSFALSLTHGPRSLVASLWKEKARARCGTREGKYARCAGLTTHPWEMLYLEGFLIFWLIYGCVDRSKMRVHVREHAERP